LSVPRSGICTTKHHRACKHSSRTILFWRTSALFSVLPRNLSNPLDSKTLDTRRIAALPEPARKSLNLIPLHAKYPNLFRLNLQGQNDRIRERLGNASRRAGASRPACRIHFKNRDTTREVVLMPFDERLFQLKLQPINQQMHADAGKCWALARAEVKRLGNHARLLPAFVECQLEVLRKYLEEVYRLRREVWLLDGNAVTPEFIRNIVVPHVFTVVVARKGAIQHELDLHAVRTGEHQRGSHILVHQMNRLQAEVANRFEIEAIELFKKESQARKVTKAPPPPREVGGLGITHTSAKPTQIPPDLPMYFPKALKARTAVILAEAVRKFQYQTQTLDLCKHVISEMIPLFCEAVRDGTMKASMALEEGLGGMGAPFARGLQRRWPAHRMGSLK
jgi:hypothetical protein